MLQYKEPIDSVDHARHCKDLLDVPFQVLAMASIATQQVMLSEKYSVNGCQVDLSDLINQVHQHKHSISPEMNLPFPQQEVRFAMTTVQVRNETTLMTARDMVANGKRPLVLNFANGTEVGGGFLRGARAQEETLCYASTLYSTLVGDPFYRYNLEHAPTVSTDYAILSQAVVFKDDKYTLIERPWIMDVLTAAAPIANTQWGGVSQSVSATLMDQRIARVLDIAIAYGYTDLVLGAWGCGAFGNDPVVISRLFEKQLKQRQQYFETVYFTIADWSPERRFLGAFAETFSS